MFTYKIPQTFWAIVTVVTPDGDEQKFSAQFNYLDDKTWSEQSQKPAADFLRDNWIGWKGIVGEDKADVPFSPEQREIFLAHAYIGLPVIAAYSQSRQGIRQKN